MSKIQDSFSDANLLLLNAKCSSLPTWVLADPIPTAEHEAPVPYAYRRPGFERFPCHTKVATFLSRAYYEIQKEQISDQDRDVIESKLAEFEKQHAIPTQDIADLQTNVRRHKSELTPDQIAITLSNKIASGRFDLGMGDIISSARELHGQGARNAVTAEFVFDKPVRGVKQVLHQIVNDMPEDSDERRANKQAAKQSALSLDSVPHRDVQDRMVSLLNQAVQTPLQLRRARQHFKTAGLQNHFDVRIGNTDYSHGTVVSALPKIAAMTGLPLMHDEFAIPVSDWEAVLTTATALQQRQIHQLLN